jgi:hypothetical protein
MGPSMGISMQLIKNILEFVLCVSHDTNGIDNDVLWVEDQGGNSSCSDKALMVIS